MVCRVVHHWSTDRPCGADCGAIGQVRPSTAGRWCRWAIGAMVGAWAGLVVFAVSRGPGCHRTINGSLARVKSLARARAGALTMYALGRALVDRARARALATPLRGETPAMTLTL